MSTERLDHSTTLPLGTRDAVHLHIVVGKFEYNIKEQFPTYLTPGSFVKFVDKEFTKFVLCEREEAHGFLNQFIKKICYYDNVIVFLLPDIATPVRHHFEIDLQKRQSEQWVLEAELEEAQSADPECASCYHIKNGRVIRS